MLGPVTDSGDPSRRGRESYLGAVGGPPSPQCSAHSRAGLPASTLSGFILVAQKVAIVFEHNMPMGFGPPLARISFRPVPPPSPLSPHLSMLMAFGSPS